MCLLWCLLFDPRHWATQQSITGVGSRKVNRITPEDIHIHTSVSQLGVYKTKMHVGKSHPVRHVQKQRYTSYFTSLWFISMGTTCANLVIPHANLAPAHSGTQQQTTYVWLPWHNISYTIITVWSRGCTNPSAMVQWLGRFLGIIGQNPIVSKSNRLHVVWSFGFAL